MSQRRDFLRFAGQSAVALLVGRRAFAQFTEEDLRLRVSLLLQEYDRQGTHRTGDRGDTASAQWLITEIRKWRVRGTLEPFSFERVVPTDNSLQFRNKRIDGVPLFDGTFTGPDGFFGKIGRPEDGTEVALVRADDPQLEVLRRGGRHKALVAVASQASPGVSLLDATSFATPYGPPVLQVSNEQAAFLDEQAASQAGLKVVINAVREPAEAFNVVARVPGRDPSLKPLVVHAGRSAWFRGTGERGGGLVCWIELLRALMTGRPLRDVLFTATAGDELGHIGLQAFLSARPGLAKDAQAWLALGESLGASRVDGTVLYASSAELAQRAAEILAGGEVRVEETITKQRPPGGMSLVHDAGGAYAVLIGRANALARSSGDRWPQAVDVGDVLQFARAFVKVGLARAIEP